MTQARIVKGLSDLDLTRAILRFEMLAQAEDDARQVARLLRLTDFAEDAALRGQAFDAIIAGLDRGLSLGASAALAAVSRRQIAAWCALWSLGREPWMSWVDGLLRKDAERRAVMLEELRKMGEVDLRCHVDRARLWGKQSPLQLEVEKFVRWPGAVSDALDAPAPAKPKDAEQPEHAAGLPEADTDSQSVAPEADTGTYEDDPCNSGNQAVPDGEPVEVNTVACFPTRDPYEEDNGALPSIELPEIA